MRNQQNRSLLLELVLVIGLFVQVFHCFDLPRLQKTEYDNILIRDDNRNYVIFTNPQLSEDTQLNTFLSTLVSSPDVNLFINDCTTNPIAQCTNIKETPLKIIVNRLQIKFNGDPHSLTDIKDWLQTRILKTPLLIKSKKQLQDSLQQKQNWFCLCDNKKKVLEKTGFLALSKAYPYFNFCFIPSETLCEELGFKPGNFTLFKTSIEDRIDYTYDNHHSAWEAFVKSNFSPFIERIQGLTNLRFSHQQKNIDVYAIVCDFTFKCEDIWEKLNQKQHYEGITNLGGGQEKVHFRISLANTDVAFFLYYHFPLEKIKLPALIHAKLSNKNQGGCGTVERHLRPVSNIDLPTVAEFIEDVRAGRIEPERLSAPAPKKNGFTGKGSQKLIQKLTADNVEEIVTGRSKHYVLLITVLEMGCQECEEFYSEFKKMASLVGTQMLTFAVLDVKKNQVPLTDVTFAPELLLYKLGQEKPVILDRRLRFDTLLSFLKDEVDGLDNQQL